MKTHRTHHATSLRTSTAAPGREAAMRWLAQQLRWERLLDELRNPTVPADEEEAA